MRRCADGTYIEDDRHPDIYVNNIYMYNGYFIDIRYGFAVGTPSLS